MSEENRICPISGIKCSRNCHWYMGRMKDCAMNVLATATYLVWQDGQALRIPKFRFWKGRRRDG